MRLAKLVHSEKLKKSEFDARLPTLRAELLEVQNSLRKANFPVIVLFAGVDGAGKSELVNLLNEWMDPRWLINRAYIRSSDSDTEVERPVFRRYWHDLPPRGQRDDNESYRRAEALCQRRSGRCRRHDDLATFDAQFHDRKTP